MAKGSCTRLTIRHPEIAWGQLHTQTAATRVLQVFRHPSSPTSPDGPKRCQERPRLRASPARRQGDARKTRRSRGAGGLEDGGGDDVGRWGSVHVEIPSWNSGADAGLRRLPEGVALLQEPFPPGSGLWARGRQSRARELRQLAAERGGHSGTYWRCDANCDGMGTEGRTTWRGGGCLRGGGDCVSICTQSATSIPPGAKLRPAPGARLFGTLTRQGSGHLLASRIDVM